MYFAFGMMKNQLALGRVDDSSMTFVTDR